MRPLVLWGPVVLVMALIFFSSSMSDPGAPPGGLSDKGAHLIVYAALGAAFLRALAGGRTAGMTAARVGLSILLSTLYGATDEFHQMFVPGRTPDVMDLVADLCGAAIGGAGLAVVARLAQRILPARRAL